MKNKDSQFNQSVTKNLRIEYKQSWDRAAHRRKDKDWLREAGAAAATRIIPLWRSKNLLEEGRPPVGRWLCVGEHGDLLERGSTQILLGLHRDIPVFAIDLSDLDESETQQLPGRFLDLRKAGAFMPHEEFAPLAYARGMCHWNRVTIYCHRCGAALHSEEAGFARRCSKCDVIVYPRTDLAVIVLVTHNDRCLLARQPHFPKGMVSALAGFVEIGESIEACVHRETFEETGLRLRNLRYVDSQPWPFPQSLMLGFRAEAESPEFNLFDEELEAARWVSRNELREPKGFFYPPPMSLAHRLIRSFVDEG